MELLDATMSELKTIEDRRREYGALDMVALVARYNSLGPKTPAGPKTFSTRAKAVARILIREDELNEQQSQEYDAAYATQEEEQAEMLEEDTVIADSIINAPLQSIDTGVMEEPIVRRTGLSIKQASMDLLMEKVSETTDGKSVGWTYDEVLVKIRAQFPGCKTSIACLRWYSVHMRQDEFRLPIRPRREALTAAVGSQSAG